MSGHHSARRGIVPTAAAIALLAALPAPRAGAQTSSHPLPGAEAAVYDLAGRVRIEGGGGSDIVVEVTRGGADAARLQVARGVIDGRQTLRVLYPSDRVVYPEMSRWSRTTLDVRSDGTFGDGGRRSSRDGDRVEIRGSGSGLDAHADLVVQVPKGKRLTLHLGVGDVQVRNVDGDLALSVSAATVTTEHTRGKLTLETGSGGVHVTDAEGVVELDAGSGGATLSGVKGPTLRLDIGSGSLRGSDVDVGELTGEVGSGGIRLDRVAAPRVHLETGSGGTTLDLLRAVDDLVIDNGSGGVTITLPATQGAEVDVETGSGGIDTDFEVQTRRLERRHLVGRIGDGKGRIRIESGSGRVQLRKR